MKTAPQRELRSRRSPVLRSVESGERMQITVDGRPVAELALVGSHRRTFVLRDEVLALLRRSSLDRKFERGLWEWMRGRPHPRAMTLVAQNRLTGASWIHPSLLLNAKETGPLLAEVAG